MDRAGKTHLATTIYNYLRDNSDTVTLIVYCGYVDPSDQNRNNFLRALIRQILQLRPELGQHIRNTYKAYCNEGKQPSSAELSSILEELISRLKDCFIIVDALDDIREEPQRYKLLTMVVGQQTKVLVTSRPVDSVSNFFSFDPQCRTCRKGSAFFIRKTFEEGDLNICETCAAGYNATSPAEIVPNAVRLDIEASQDDLRKYVRWRIDGSGPLASCLKRQDNLREELVDTVVERAEGM